MIFGALGPLAHNIFITQLGKCLAKRFPNLVIISVGPFHKQKATVVLLKHDQNHMEPRRNHAGVEGFAEAKQTFAQMLAL